MVAFLPTDWLGSEGGGGWAAKSAVGGWEGRGACQSQDAHHQQVGISPDEKESSGT